MIKFVDPKGQIYTIEGIATPVQLANRESLWRPQPRYDEEGAALIKRLATEAGLRPVASGFRTGLMDGVSQNDLARFAASVAERCAEICDSGGFHDEDGVDWAARKIRERFKKETA